MAGDAYGGAATRKARKRMCCNVLAGVIGLALAWAFDLQVLRALGAEADPQKWLDVLVTGFIISSGTEGINSIVKFLGYKKEEKKDQAATAASLTTPALMANIDNRSVDPALSSDVASGV